MKYINVIYFVVFSVLILGSCSDEKSANIAGVDEIESKIVDKIKETEGNIYKYKDALFSVPSPFEVTSRIHKKGIAYDEKAVNPLSKVSLYTNQFTKALNLGVYSVDLAYLNVYGQVSEVAKYFSAVQGISEDIHLLGIFDRATMERVENNINSSDSMLFILSQGYGATGEYLKENQKEDVGALILAGAWIEANYFLVKINNKYSDKEISRRLGEQKYPLQSLLKVLEPHYNSSEQYKQLINVLKDLSDLYDKVKIEYQFVKPETDKSEKITYINSLCSHKINGSLISEISDKIEKIRYNITK